MKIIDEINAREERKKSRARAYYQLHREILLTKSKKYHAENRKRVPYSKKRAVYFKMRKKTDVQFRLSCSLRNRVGKAIKRNSEFGSAVKDLGCSIEQLKVYLESKFSDGMTWDNWGKNGWHIDHVIPLSFFDLSKRELFLQATHYTNLQPLWAIDNLRKSARIPS